MDIKCARCGKTIQVPDNLTEGQHVRCPHCHEKFSYAMQQGGVTKDGSRTAGSDSAGAGAGAEKTPGTLNMTCGHCGKEVRVADDLKDGQHIRCPYCGEKSSYRKTSFDKKSTKITASEMQTALRTCLEDVELKRLFKCAPDGAKKVIKLTFYSTVFPERIDGHKFRVNLREIEPELTEEDLRYLIRFETDDWLKNRFKGLLDGTSNDKDEGLPCKLGVRRSGESAPIVDLNAEAIKRKMDADERERAEMAERGAAARKAAYIDALKRKAVFIAAIAALVLGGLVWFSSWDAARRKREADARARAELAQEEELARYEAERKAVREKQEKTRAERELQEAKRRAEYETARAERLAKEEKRDAERAARQREMEEKESVVKSAREKRREIEKMFSGADLLPWNALPKQQRPGAVDGVFRCMIQSSNDTVACCEVESKADGVIKVREAGRDGIVEVDFDEWNKKLSAFGGVVHTGTQAYLFAPKAIEGGGSIPGCDFDPSRMRLGCLRNLIIRYDMGMSRFAFEIRLSSPELKDTLLVDTVAFDGYARRRNIEACIRDAATGLVKKPSVKMKKRTVVLYDGSIVKRQMNGITLVPRNPTRYDARYTELLDEAERQEREAEMTVQAASDRYQDEIARKVEKIWSSATIYIGLRTR